MLYFIWDLFNFLRRLPFMLSKPENFILFLCGVFLLFILKKRIQRLKILYSGYKGEKTVSNILKRISKNRFIVMNDVLLPLYDDMTQIDHLVIGPFGVICVETKNHSGRITGKAEDINWKQRLGFKTYTFHNPLAQNYTHIQAIRYFLHKEKVLNVPIYNLVVFSSNNVSIELAEDNLPVIPASYLKKYFKDKAFNESKIDVDQVVKAIKKHQIIDKSAKQQHIKYLKKIYG